MNRRFRGENPVMGWSDSIKNVIVVVALKLVGHASPLHSLAHAIQGFQSTCCKRINWAGRVATGPTSNRKRGGHRRFSEEVPGNSNIIRKR